jgi:hypothetical protein
MLFADAMAIVLAFPCCIQNHHHHTHFSYYLSASYQVGPFIVVFNFQHRFVLRLTLHKQTIIIGSQIILFYLNIIYRYIRIVHLNSISVHIRIIKMFTGMITFVLRVLLTSAPGALFKHSIYRSFLLKKLSITISNALTLRIPVKIL